MKKAVALAGLMTAMAGCGNDPQTKVEPAKSRVIKSEVIPLMGIGADIPVKATLDGDVLVNTIETTYPGMWCPTTEIGEAFCALDENQCKAKSITCRQTPAVVCFPLTLRVQGKRDTICYGTVGGCTEGVRKAKALPADASEVGVCEIVRFKAPSIVDKMKDVGRSYEISKEMQLKVDEGAK